MNTRDRAKLDKKLAANRKKLDKKNVLKFKEQIMAESEDFSERFVFADKYDVRRLAAFVAELYYKDFRPLAGGGKFLGDEKVWVCFLGGSRELFEIFIGGSFAEVKKEFESFEMFSSLFLITDDKLEKTLIFDNGIIY
ncbi:MAG: hypothetical protein IIZ09_13290 [Ruminococcus sp.]|nr:hypothetical protein [Ruminococcus sp.]